MDRVKFEKKIKEKFKNLEKNNINVYIIMFIKLFFTLGVNLCNSCYDGLI